MKGYTGRVLRDIQRQLDGLADDTLRKRIEGDVGANGALRGGVVWCEVNGTGQGVPEGEYGGSNLGIPASKILDILAASQSDG